MHCPVCVNGPQQSDQTPSSVPVILPDVFVRSVLFGHSAATAAAAGIMYSMPSLPSQATIDQSHDLIPFALCGFDFPSVYYRCSRWPVDVYMNLSAVHATLHLSFPPTLNVVNSVCVMFICTRAYVCMTL